MEERTTLTTTLGRVEVERHETADGVTYYLTPEPFSEETLAMVCEMVKKKLQEAGHEVAGPGSGS